MTYSNYPSGSQQEKPATTGKDNRNIIYGLLIVALLGTWGFLVYDKSKSKETTSQLQAQLLNSDSGKNVLQTEYNSALQRLDELTSMNTSLDSLVKRKNSEVSSLKSRIQSLLNKQNKSAADLAEAKRLINELNSKVSEYVTEVETLRGENLQLKTEKQEVIVQKEMIQREYDSTKVVKQKAEEKLDVASTLNASNISLVAIDERKNGKEVEKTVAKRIDKIRVSFNVFNRVGDEGAKDVFVVVMDPAGNIVSNEALGSGRFVTREEGEKVFTQKSNVNFAAGQVVPVTVEWKPGTKFVEGSYKIAIYNNGFKIGETSKNLKKGGLFS
jgi:myosin heavy subunit